MSRARSRISRRTPCNLVTRNPYNTVVEESPSVLAIIQHIILFHPRLLWTAIQFLTIILYIILFFTRKPNDTVVEENPSVLANIQHIILFHPCFLYKAIRILTFILYIIPFFLNFLYQAITSPSNPPSPTPLPGPNQTSPTTPRNTPRSQKAALPPTTKPNYLRSHAQPPLSNLPMNSMISTTQPRKRDAAGSLIKSQSLSSVHGMCLRGGRGRVDHSV